MDQSQWSDEAKRFDISDDLQRQEIGVILLDGGYITAGGCHFHWNVSTVIFIQFAWPSCVLNRPNGVNLGKTDPTWLVDGDVVEVGLENVGTCTNALKYV